MTESGPQMYVTVPDTPEGRFIGKLLDEAAARRLVADGGQVQPLMPSERTVEEGREGDLVIFDDDDVVQALHQFDAAGGKSFYGKKRLAAMRLVMMFSLQIAAVNLGVK